VGRGRLCQLHTPDLGRALDRVRRAPHQFNTRLPQSNGTISTSVSGCYESNNAVPTPVISTGSSPGKQSSSRSCRRSCARVGCSRRSVRLRTAPRHSADPTVPTTRVIKLGARCRTRFPPRWCARLRGWELPRWSSSSFSLSTQITVIVVQIVDEGADERPFDVSALLDRLVLQK